MGLQSKHPAVSEVVTPTSSRTAVNPDSDAPLPTPLESATPHLAVAQADLEAEEAAGEAKDANARARALAGHRAPDTIDLPEAKVRADDNDVALRGPGHHVPLDADEASAKAKTAKAPAK